jgi:quercetin dioxygenase-like cupin family protein
MSSHELGYFGNIWVRQHVLERKEDKVPGHKHFFDHVTLLTKGKVEVTVEGKEPKQFTAPTFIVIKKEQEHKIVALEDDTIYYCVFALRNIDGEVIGDIYGEQHDPNSAQTCPEDYWEKVKKIENI